MDLPALPFDTDRELVDAPLGHEALARSLEEVFDIPTCRRAHDYRSFPYVPFHPS